MFILHGTPGSRVGPFPKSRVLYELGVRLISFDRPGYGGSDRLDDRRVADVVPDVVAIADELELTGSRSSAVPAADRTRSPARPCCPSG